MPIALLASCVASTPTPSGQSSDSSQIESFNPSPSGKMEAEQVAVIHSDMGLSEYLRVAALNNPGLEASFNLWKAAMEKVPQVKSLPDPKFNYGYFIEEVETRVGPQEQKFGIAQTFPWFGKLRLRGEKAGEAAIAAQERFEVEKRQLFFEVKDAYYELFYLSQATSIAQENIELMKHLEKVAQAKFRSGSDVTGVVKAQVELGKLEDRLLSLEDLRSPIAAKLNAAMNRPSELEIPWPTEFDLTLIDFSSLEIAEALRKSNPELKALAAKILEEEKAVELAKKEFWPDLTLGVDYIDTGDARMTGVSDSGNDPVMLMGSINIPLWYGKYRAGVREAKARRAAAFQSWKDKENGLTADLKMILYKFRDAQRKISLFRDTLTPLARNSLVVAEQAYKAGQSDFLELIDAQRLLLEIQLSYLRSVADREQRLAQIEKVIGKDLLSLMERTITKEIQP